MTQPEIQPMTDIGLENEITTKYHFVGFQTEWNSPEASSAVPVHVFTAGYSGSLGPYTPETRDEFKDLMNTIDTKLNQYSQSASKDLLGQIAVKGKEAKIAVINAKFVAGNITVMNPKSGGTERISSTSVFELLKDSGYEVVLISVGDYYEDTIFDSADTPIPVLFSKRVGSKDPEPALVLPGTEHFFSAPLKKDDVRSMNIIDRLKNWWAKRYAIPDTEHLKDQELIDLAIHYASVVGYDQFAAALSIPAGVLLFGLSAFMENPIPAYLGAISIVAGSIYGYDSLRLTPKSNFLNSKAGFDDIEERLESGDHDAGFVITLNINGKDIKANIILKDDDE